MATRCDYAFALQDCNEYYTLCIHAVSREKTVPNGYLKTKTRRKAAAHRTATEAQMAILYLLCMSKQIFLVCPQIPNSFFSNY